MASISAGIAPLVRPDSRASSHDNDSEYSLNLDALPRSNHNDSTLDFSQSQRDIIDIVRTDDIDGPTDFTQNLEYWMRLKLPNVVEPTTLQGQGKMDLEQYISSDEALSVSVEAPQTPTGAKGGAEQTAEAADIKGTIERQSTGAAFVEDDDRQFNGVDAVQSEPSPSNRPRSRLQPSVEDYEDSPSQMRAARSASTSSTGENLRRTRIKARVSHAARQVEANDNNEMTSSPSAGQSMMVRRLREELEELRSQSEHDIQRLKQDHEAELQREISARERHASHEAQKLKHLEEQLEKEKHTTRNQLREKDHLHSKAMKLEKELLESNKTLQNLRDHMETTQQSSKQNLEIMRTEHEKQLFTLQQKPASNLSLESQNLVSKLESELAHIKQQLSIRDQKLHNLQEKLADRENALNLAEQRAEEAESILDEMGQAHREEMQNEQEIHDMQVSALEEQAESLKREFNKSHEELADAKRSLADTRAALLLARQELSDKNTRFQDLQEELEALKTKALAAVERRQVTNSKLVASREQHSRDLDRLKATHTQEKLNIHKQAENAVLKMRDLLGKERNETKRLRQEIEKSTSSNGNEHDELEDLRNEIRIANDHAEDVERKRDQLKGEIEKMDKALDGVLLEARKTKAELQATKQDINVIQEEHQVINEIVAKKVHEAVQTKELEWKRMLQDLEREMEIRSKLLMIEWGRNEIGFANPQPYKYKYLSEGVRRA